MKKFIYLTAILPILAGCANVTHIGTVNGTELTRVTTRGVFSPSSSIVIAANPETPGEIEVLNTADQSGVLNAVATAGGVVGGAALLRPARSSTTSNSNGGSSNGGSSGAYAKGGNGGKGGDSIAVNSNSNKSSSDSSAAAVAVSSSSSAASAKNNNENSNKIQVEAPKHVCPPKCREHGNN